MEKWLKNFNDLSAGRVTNDNIYTLKKSVYDLFPLLTKNKGRKIMCPFDTKDSAFVKVFTELNYDISYSDIRNNKDFWSYKKGEFENYDFIISNPPFSFKTEILFALINYHNVPFILLLPCLSFWKVQNYQYFSKGTILLPSFGYKYDKTDSIHESDNHKDARILFGEFWFAYKMFSEKLIYLAQYREDRHNLKIQKSFFDLKYPHKKPRKKYPKKGGD